MIEIEFNYNGKETIIFGNLDQKIGEIFKKFSEETSTDINSVYFLYEGYKISDKLSLSQIINSNDKKKNKMKIIVNSNNFQNYHEIQPIFKSKEIICPKCGDSINIKIKDYKILLYDCKNRHKIENILLDEFAKTQYINEENIICDNCKAKNKSNTYNNIFYRCCACKMNLCPFCKPIHNQTHNIINYDKKNYICDLHGEIYNSYCQTCKKNICFFCKDEHYNHNIICFKNAIPNKEKTKIKFE